VARDGRAVLVLVAEARGSAPRAAGAAMLVSAGRPLGTVGGGAVEHRATGIARDMLAKGTERGEIEFPLGPATDQCCGGWMRLAFALLTRERLPAHFGAGSGQHCAELELWGGGPIYHEPAPDRQVVVYGAGHVGHALVTALTPLPFRLVWVDARAGGCAGAPEGVEVHETPLPEAVAEAAEPGTLHVVLTHSHALDLEIVAAVLRRPFGFCGLIGSATKRELFRRRLAERGTRRAAIERLTCPIGLPGLRDKRPAVIAASVAAQLLQVDAALAARQPTVRAG
jgi:xanthine dehydrogenase accessory protein XdhC